MSDLGCEECSIQPTKRHLMRYSFFHSFVQSIYFSNFLFLFHDFNSIVPPGAGPLGAAPGGPRGGGPAPGGPPGGGARGAPLGGAPARKTQEEPAFILRQ